MSDKERQIHPNVLPNCEKAEIPRSKLAEYALDPLHAEGQHKARVFRSALGFEQSNWEDLKNAILTELPYNEAVFKSEGKYGKKYEVVLPITGPNGNTTDVITAWIIRPDTDFPSLVTTLVAKKKEDSDVES
jgi:hypothetical protein